MITIFKRNQENILVHSSAPLPEADWIDLFRPNDLECRLLEDELNIIIPLHDETRQLEFSNRFYVRNSAIYLSINALVKPSHITENHIVTFIILKDKLITLYYSEPNPIEVFINTELPNLEIRTHRELFRALIQMMVGDVADLFEIFDEQSDRLSHNLKISMSPKTRGNSQGLHDALGQINNLQNLLSKGYQSLSSMRLALSFLKQIHIKTTVEPLSEEFITLEQDIRTLLDHAEYLTQKVEFQLEASIGLISLEQSNIIKTFTVLAMIFMPPTLIASIYGMNFRFMPELFTVWGYPFSIFLMIVSALLPYRFFRKRGWI